MRMNNSARLLLAYAGLSCLLVLGGCLFQEKDRAASAKGGGWEDFPNADQNLCGDLTQEQMAKADSLVAAARPHLDGEAVFLASDSAEAWSQLKRRDIDTLDGYYSRTLKAAPNHCGALFGKAIVTAYSVIRDPALDSLIQDAEGSNDGGPGIFAKLTATDAASGMLDVRRGLAKADKSLLTLAQQVGERVLLPKLDSSIADLDRVVAHPEFRFRIGDGDKVRELSFDRGEASPLLATLKIAKALVILVVAYDWRAEIDEGYPFFQVLKDMDEKDFRHLTVLQREALDHYTGLISRGSAFTRIRAGWEARTASIPGLLNQAVQHVQDGLEYGIIQEQKRLDQSKDPYRVGIDEGSDIDPADLRDAIDRLERIKKYLTGEVALTYARNSRTLRVDFPKIFQVNGLQGLLPYFRFHPYEEWMERIPADDSTRGLPEDSTNGAADDSTQPLILKSPFYFTDAKGDSTLEGYDLDGYSDNIAGLTGKVVFPDPTLGGIFPDLTNANFWATVESLRDVESRVSGDCSGTDPSHPPVAGCRLPVKPSDLDILLYFLQMGFF
ncbi:MAG: hypothetical protein ABIW76_12345 [Fibrobacteria bacterium]